MESFYESRGIVIPPFLVSISFHLPTIWCVGHVLYFSLGLGHLGPARVPQIGSSVSSISDTLVDPNPFWTPPPIHADLFWASIWAWSRVYQTRYPSVPKISFSLLGLFWPLWWRHLIGRLKGYISTGFSEVRILAALFMLCIFCLISFHLDFGFKDLKKQCSIYY